MMKQEQIANVVDALEKIHVACDRAGKARIDHLLTELEELAHRERWIEIRRDALRLREELRSRAGMKGIQAEELDRLDRLWERIRAEAFGFRWGPSPAALPTDPEEISNWLRVVGLEFNPFGPEAAELDPRLYTYGVGAVFERGRGRRPVLVYGASGCGKTGAALLLTWLCVEPPEHPREEGAFPVYYTPPSDLAHGDGYRVHLAAAVQAIAHTLARHVAHRSESFLNLPRPRKYGLARLLSLWTRSAEDLAAWLQRVGPDRGTDPRLIQEMEALYQEVPDSDMTELAYLDLLSGTRLGGFECLYLLGDVPGREGGPRARSTAESLRPLIELIVPLASRGVCVKLFLPDELRDHLGGLGDYEEMSLTWSRIHLRKMLADRFRKAGGEGLGAMCLPPHPDLDKQLVEVADGSPRRLIRAGNALLRAHVQASGEPLFKAQWAADFLEELGGNNA